MVVHVCLVSGGTGGHLLPAAVLARAMREAGHDPVVLTEGRAAEHALLQHLNCRAECLSSRSGRSSVLGLMRATVRARQFLRDERTDLVIGTGGRATVPVVLAARSLGVPFALMEQNAVAGRANRLLSRFARRVYLGLPVAAAPRRALLTGTPVRAELGGIERNAARRSLGLDPALPVVLVTGGSQGAQVLNDTVPAALVSLRRPLQVVHLAGAGHDAQVRARYTEAEADGLTAVVRSYAGDMPSLYAAADLVICRGGGSTVAELCAAGRGAIIVPYPHHRDRQQLVNARILEQSGAAVVVEQGALSAEGLAALTDRLLVSGEVATMGQRAESLARRDSCHRIMADLGLSGAVSSERLGGGAAGAEVGEN